MSERDFFDDAAKGATAASVKLAEARTSAEVVVAVRQRSGHYGTLAYHFGLGLAAITVAYLLVVPTIYSPFAIALDGILAFLLGALLAANFDTLLRGLSRRRTLASNVSVAARAAFFDLGISRTTGRGGVLVYVSLFERSAVVLTDIGIDEGVLGATWRSATLALEQAIKRRDLAAFLRAIEALGPSLGAAYPRSEDDVNELLDEVQ